MSTDAAQLARLEELDALKALREATEKLGWLANSEHGHQWEVARDRYRNAIRAQATDEVKGVLEAARAVAEQPDREHGTVENMRLTQQLRAALQRFEGQGV